MAAAKGSVSSHLVCTLMASLVWWSNTGAFAAAQKDANPIVVTKYGRLEGKQVTVKGTDRPVYQYLNVPFAKPPVGSLRFAPPQPPEAWTGTRKSTEYPSVCMQNVLFLEIVREIWKLQFPPVKISEDCLYLNIYTPLQPKERTRKLPVMVFIHGGGFAMGGALLGEGTALAAYEDVVMVIIQYRLGLLGFLSSGDEHMRGNWGLLDQVEALRWVKNNIDVFGGDPGSVTIFGESAGGMSVSMHVVSPLSSGLFHKAISQSGSAILEMFTSRDPKPRFQELVNLSDCEADNFQEIFACLQEMSTDKLVNVTDLMFAKHVHIMPSVDGVFLPKHPADLFATKQVNAVPYLLGINNHEFGWLLPQFLNLSGWQEGVDREEILPHVKLFFKSSLYSRDVLELVINEYIGDVVNRSKIRDVFLELMGDIIMMVPTVQAARLHRDAGNPVFLYEFQHRPSMFETIRPDFVKADHGDEIGFVFGAPFWNGDINITGSITEEEAVFSRTMMSYWANFARKGCPNGEGLVYWPLYDHEERYMPLDIKQEPGTKLKEHRMEFWTTKLPKQIEEMNAQRGTNDSRVEENIQNSDL